MNVPIADRPNVFRGRNKRDGLFHTAHEIKMKPVSRRGSSEREGVLHFSAQGYTPKGRPKGAKKNGKHGGPQRRGIRLFDDFLRLCHRKRLMLYFLEIPKK